MNLNPLSTEASVENDANLADMFGGTQVLIEGLTSDLFALMGAGGRGSAEVDLCLLLFLTLR